MVTFEALEHLSYHARHTSGTVDQGGQIVALDEDAVAVQKLWKSQGMIASYDLALKQVLKQRQEAAQGISNVAGIVRSNMTGQLSDALQASSRAFPETFRPFSDDDLLRRAEAFKREREILTNRLKFLSGGMSDTFQQKRTTPAVQPTPAQPAPEKPKVHPEKKKKLVSQKIPSPAKPTERKSVNKVTDESVFTVYKPESEVHVVHEEPKVEVQIVASVSLPPPIPEPPKKDIPFLIDEAPDVIHEEPEVVSPVIERMDIPPLGLTSEDERAIGALLKQAKDANVFDAIRVRRACQIVFDSHQIDNALLEGVVQDLLEMFALQEGVLQSTDDVPQAVSHKKKIIRMQRRPAQEKAASPEALRTIELEFLGRTESQTRNNLRLSRESLTPDLPPQLRQQKTIREMTAEEFLRFIGHRDTSEDTDLFDDSLEDDEFGYNDKVGEDIDFAALGISPHKPTAAKPGTEEKVLMLTARYQDGIPLWHNKDCYEHSGDSVTEFLEKIGGVHKEP